MSATRAPLRVDREQAEFFELLRQGRDINFFFSQILGIDVNPAQERWFRFINPEENGWEWRYKLVVHVAANQIGKTLGIAGIILWACIYKIGVPLENERAWLDRPYQWFHLAPTQQQAYLPLKDIVQILAGSHPAQRRPPKLPAGFVSTTKLEQYYDGLTFWNGAVCHFRTTEDKGKALQGRRAAGISFDECAFELHLKSVINETLMMRLISTGGPLFLVSTPNGINDYYEVVQSIIDRGRMVGERAWASDDAQAVVWSIITDNAGFGLSPEDIARMEQDLDESTKEQQLRGAFLEPAEAFFTPATELLKAFTPRLPDQELPVPGHRYVVMWDPSVASDPTAVVVLDVTNEPWRGVYFKHYRIAPNVQTLMGDIYALHALYGSATDRGGWKRSSVLTGFDATSMGGAILKQQLANLHPQRPLNFAGPSAKLDALTDLRAALLRRRLVLPQSWSRMQRELLNYRLKDDKLQQDAVMALAGAAHIAAKGFSGVQHKAFAPKARITRVVRP